MEAGHVSAPPESPPPAEEEEIPPPPTRRSLVVIAVLLAAVVSTTLIVAAVRSASGSGDGAGAGSSAGVLQAWGEPTFTEEFDAPLGPEWAVYDGPGHVGNGIRSPQAVQVADGVLTITGDAEGTTGGLALLQGQKYGRWEARVRAPASDETYHALLLLWPDAEDWPVGGEIDFMEMLDPTRQRTKLFVHYGADNSQVHGDVEVNGTQWHNWAVEWSPEHIIAYLDGNEWFRTSDPEVFPPGPMHLAIQLDWFPENSRDGEVQESQMQVDWVKQYPI
jgi:beta-glucanase (GH16 family)